MNHNLCHFSYFTMPLVNFVYNRAETISFLGPTVWGIIPSEIKQKESLEAIKWEIKTWKPEIVHDCANVIELELDL